MLIIKDLTEQLPRLSSGKEYGMKTGLLLIDVQNDYFPGGRMELHGSEAASLRASEILAVFRKLRLPIFHVQHISERPGASFFLPGTRGAEIHDNVRPLPEEPVVRKNFPNSFRSTDLLARLEQSEIRKLIICGMMTHMCVDATVRAAFDHGFECVTVHDACATRSYTFNGESVSAEKVHAAFLGALEAVYSRVVEAGEVIKETEGRTHE
jgi:nicotinamidase-related amidase